MQFNVISIRWEKESTEKNRHKKGQNKNECEKKKL